MGDMAMLQVAFKRIGEFWPGAVVQVITGNPEYLSALCPTAEPVPVSGKRGWLADRHLPRRINRFLPKTTSEQVVRLNRGMRRHLPITFHAAMWLEGMLRGTDGQDLGVFLNALYGADLLLICGQGGLTDHAQPHAKGVLGLMEIAIQRETPVAMLSQGIGPIEDGELFAAAKMVLPHVDFIALRESRAGLPLLRRLGVDQSRVITTGDDAIELAYEARPRRPGIAVGINLRVARSSEVDHKFVPMIRRAICSFSSRHNAPLVPIPIGRGVASQDARTMRQILAGVDDLSDGGETLDTPLKVIDQVARCRVVITGAYHAAVFALAQGIPAVCLAKSQYFIDKFLGLADQFGPGCEVVLLNNPRHQEELAAALNRMWRTADELRQSLQKAAWRQICTGREGYQRIAEVVVSKGAVKDRQPGPVYEGSTS
jgi:polysaccharide pyruvyl transferase WcaK-like protein